MGTFFIVGVSLILISYMHMKANKAAKIANKKNEEFLKREQEANSTRNSKLDDFIFVKPKNIPIFNKQFVDDLKHEKIINKQKTILKIINVKMVHFDEVYTNTDLKLKYGVGNLANLITYEENFNIFIRHLNEFASDLLKANYEADAIEVLTYAISLGSQISETYTILYKIYEKLNYTEKIDELIQVAKNKLLEVSYNKFNENIAK